MKEYIPKYRIIRKFAWAFIVITLVEAWTPTIAFALTGGPGQPSFSSFEPVATTNMVNEFTGDFTYNLPVLNIPGANGGGYALSLSYHSGGSPEEEASWVGYGWTLNPGAINRNKRGFPDDDSNTAVTYYNQAPANQTVTLGGGVGGIELFSLAAPVNLNLSASLGYNNYKGFSYNIGVGIEYAKGLISLGYSISNGTHSFSVAVNPGAALTGFQNDDGSKAKNDPAPKKSDITKDGLKKNPPKKKFSMKAEAQHIEGHESISLVGSKYGIFSHEFDVKSTQIAAYSGLGVNLSLTLMPTPSPVQAGINGSLSGSYVYQKNNDTTQTHAYGYMYSGNVSASQNAMMDYSVEKLKPYTKWDTHIGIPYSNADEFSVTGEGIGGGFRLYNTHAGWFHPAPVSSNMTIINAGGAVELGLNVGGGADLGVGFENLDITNDWDATQINNDQFASEYSTVEPYFFAFSDDLGGGDDFDGDAPEQANWSYNSGVFASYTPDVSGIAVNMNSDSRIGRSSYIAHHKNNEMTQEESGYPNPYQPYARGKYISQFISRTESDLSSQIGEFAVFNQDGTCYSYGLPVYSRNETNLQYSLEQATIDSNYLAYEDVVDGVASGKVGTKVGEEEDVPYATTYLLTSITTPDYVDRTLNGPTDDDYGGWTQFIYSRLWGSTIKSSQDSLISNWYHWRSPYTGLLYHPNTLSTIKDDFGSVSSGYKEVYVLDTIKTKTHFAVFRSSERGDGFDAAGGDSADNNPSAKGPHYLKQLNRIDLYARNNGSPQLIESVHFEYDNSTGLCPNIPNFKGPGTNSKLTLKRVWFDYNGTMNARISPYEFDYAYSTDKYPLPYSNSYASMYNSSEQNPAYSYFELDAWGNYQYGGGARYANMENWLNQNPFSSFDPAAWQLKVIKLPSGGEIHIQYDQKDYAYVQDQPAEAMVSLLGPLEQTAGDDNPSFGNLAHLYYLRTHDLGIDSTDQSAVDSVTAMMNTYYVNPNKKIFFKFLYTLVGGSVPYIGECNAEYITGYCDISRAGTQRFGSPGNYYYRPYVTLGSTSGGAFSNYDLPKEAAEDFYNTQRLGNLNSSGNCDPSTAGFNPSSGSSAVSIAYQFVVFLATAIGGSAVVANEVSYVNSYMRIPLPRAKKGGGVRVRKLLMFDPGIDMGDTTLYGNEYDYITETGQSSGVATNEPTAIRDENTLVQFDPQKRQTFLQKVIAGVDRDMTEVPYDESVLPGASIGYSRVLVKNIYTGKTNPGFSVDEYYTAKDYPVQVQSTSLSTETSYSLIPAWIANYLRNDVWLSQGFSVTLNNMHGQIKSKTTYGGDPDDFPSDAIGTQEVYNYFQPGEQIPLMGSPNSLSYSNQGKQSETIMESRGTEDIDNDISLEFDADVGFIPFIPFVVVFYSFVPYYTYNENKLYTHAITKVNRYPALVKSIYSYADGISHTTQNLAFSATTGKAVLTRTTDGYDQLNLQQSANHNGTYTSYAFPAQQEYPFMGQKASNERAIIASSSNVAITEEFSSGNYFLNFNPVPGQSVCSAMGSLSAGDLIKLTDVSSGADYGVFNISDIVVGDNMYLYPTAAYGTNSSGVGHTVKIEVIHSGKTNQLSKSAGSFTTYGDTAITNNVSSIQLAARVKFAHLLDSAYQISGSLSNGNIPPGLTVDNSGYCSSLVVKTISCSKTDSNVNFEINGIFHNCQLPFKQGDFAIDPNTDQLSFYAPGNFCQPVDVCLTFCPRPLSTAQVVQADAQTYNDVWPYDQTIFPTIAGSNYYENGTKGKWRQQGNYVYKDTVTSANGTGERTYLNAGIFPLELFNWQLPETNDTTKWIKLNTVTKYSPDGNDIEEEDVLGVYSTAKFGYNDSQPYLVAKNSDYSSSLFESFENLYQVGTAKELEDGWTPTKPSDWDTTNSHAGSASWKLPVNDSLNLKTLTYTQQMQANTLLLKVWVKDTTTTTGTPIIGRIINSGSTTTKFNFQQVARTGIWTLYQANVDSADFANAGVSLNAYFNLYIRNNYAGATNWLDDLRVQPADAEMNTYVYDKRLRLVTSFDDQNFGLFYQYNGEGKLVRKQVETLEGIRTISESQYHTKEQLLQ